MCRAVQLYLAEVKLELHSETPEASDEGLI